MHDPHTQAFEIRYPWPWPKGRHWKVRSPLLTIWHKDPEKDGSDDSCGWSYPHLTKKQQDKIDKATSILKEDVGIIHREIVSNQNDWNETDLILATCDRMAWNVFGLRGLYKRGLLARCLTLSTCPYDNIRIYARSVLDQRKDWEENLDTLARCCTRVIAQAIRPWWKHPRWHILHWRLQVHPYQAFKRWWKYSVLKRTDPNKAYMDKA